MTFTYNINVPNGPNDPADDQPQMLTNTVSISNLIAVDHIGFNVPEGGLHKQVTMNNQTPPGIGTGDGVFFASLNNSNSYPAWQNALGPIAMMTNPPLQNATGYSPLPGGMLIQWGIGTTTGTNTLILFGTSFSLLGVAANPYTVVCTPQSSVAAGIFAVTAVSSVNFNFQRAAVANYSFYWIAIGTKT
jgi:hypothetical protein